MQTLLVGKPGAGKSLKLVKEVIIPAAAGEAEIHGKAGLPGRPGRKPRHVVTNVPLYLDRIERDFPTTRGFLHQVGVREKPFADVENLERWSTAYVNDDGLGPLFVIDEAHIDNPKKAMTEEKLNFFTLHRKYGVDIWLATQRIGQLNRALAELSEEYIIIARSRLIGLGKDKYRQWTYDGYPQPKDYLDYKGNLKHDRKYWKYYKSHNSDAVKEQGSDQKSLFMRPVFLLLYATTAFAIYMGVTTFLPLLFKKDDPQVLAIEEASPVVLPPPPYVPPPEPVQVASVEPEPVLEVKPSLVDAIQDTAQAAMTLPPAPVEIGPGAPPTGFGSTWNINGWVAFTDQAGNWTCSPQFLYAGKTMKPWGIKAKLKWKDMQFDFDSETRVCTATITETEGSDPIIEAVQL